MLFNSVHFLVFFPIVLFLYFTVKHKYRWILLLISSYYFYMSWNSSYIILIILSTIVDYFAALKIGNTNSKKEKKAFILISLIMNLGLLFFFKYFDFFIDSMQSIYAYFGASLDPPKFDILLPVGISFYTFQTLSYTIDVYRGDRAPEKHFGIFALYVSFFPQLVAGPIERSVHLLPQFYEKVKFDVPRVVSGLRKMLWGFFKKIMIADRVAIMVDVAYNDPELYSGFPLILATILFAFQIYCDFSAYSDIAIGAARIMGFDLMNNFDRPYFSKSISEFWRRWHISLSTWFRDYVYIPLGGSKTIKWKWYYNLFITFAISGLWHGANWTFIIWGALNGFYLVFAIMVNPFVRNNKLLSSINNKTWSGKVINASITFALICISWVYFRAESVNEANYILYKGFTGIFDTFRALINGDLTEVRALLKGNGWGFTRLDLFLSIFALFLMEFVHFKQRGVNLHVVFNRQPKWLRWSAYYVIIFLILFFGAYSDKEFIYFQF